MARISYCHLFSRWCFMKCQICSFLSLGHHLARRICHKHSRVQTSKVSDTCVEPPVLLGQRPSLGKLPQTIAYSFDMAVVDFKSCWSFASRSCFSWSCYDIPFDFQKVLFCRYPSATGQVFEIHMHLNRVLLIAVD